MTYSPQSFPKCDFDSFFAAMRRFGTVYAPRPVSELSFAYKEVSEPGEISFQAVRTILPAKKFFYPQSEDIIQWSGVEISVVEPEPKTQVIFGVHPCELAGIAILDTIFGAAPADHHYRVRRDNTLVVGTSCMPDQHCFCKSTGTDSPVAGYDIFLTDLGENYSVKAGSPRGETFLSNLGLCVETAEQRLTCEQFWLDRDKSFLIGFEPDGLHSTLDDTWESTTWDELGKRCLSCGNCTPVCPTCYCFDLVDIAQLNGTSTRHREWDSCQFSGFASVAGGFNFRATPVERLKFWYRHKLYGFEDAYGLPTCIGCGRCTVSCPAGIDDIVGLVKSLQVEQQAIARSLQNAKEIPDV